MSKEAPLHGEASEATIRIWKNKTFARFADDEGISDAALCQAIEEVAQEKAVSLGGNVYKARVARPGAGKSGGYRTLICFRPKPSERAFFVFGFAKNERDNISDKELRAFRELANKLLRRTEDELNAAVKGGELIEVFCNEEELRK